MKIRKCLIGSGFYINFDKVLIDEINIKFYIGDFLVAEFTKGKKRIKHSSTEISKACNTKFIFFKFQEVRDNVK